jgi:ATP-binding cassette subfamily B protein
MQNPYLSLLNSLWHYGANFRTQIVIYSVAFVIAQSFMSLSPYAFGRAIDILQNFTPERVSEVTCWLAFGVAAMLLFWIFHGPARVIERSVAMKIQQSFKQNIYAQLTLLPLKWHQDHHTGNIITRLNRASTALQRFAEHQYVYIETIVRFLISTSFLLWISLPIGLISLSFCFLIIIPMLLFDRKLIPLYDAENEVDNRLGSVLYDYINNMTTVLTLRLADLTRTNLGQRMLAIWPIFHKAVVLNELKWFIMMMTLSIIQATVLVGYVLYSLQHSNIIQLGFVAMIFRYQSELSAVFHELSSQLGEIVRMDTDVKSIKPILDDMQKHARTPNMDFPAHDWQTLEIRNLSFHHSATEERGQVFDGLDFTLKRGEKLALIGLSGGGKSTLLNLLCGLYTPSEVQLHIDGKTFDSLLPLQAIATLIPQDPEIFENSVGFNITLDLPAEAEEIHTAINLAGFANVLATLPEGLKTDIREKGLNFSIGQRQRLALARGLFAAQQSSLILMDEPTSSVDLPTEKQILENIIDAYPDKAVIISLHRLHLLPHFDSILMLDKGKVVAAGPAKELLATPGPVRDVWLAYNGSDTPDREEVDIIDCEEAMTSR